MSVEEFFPEQKNRQTLGSVGGWASYQDTFANLSNLCIVYIPELRVQAICIQPIRIGHRHIDLGWPDVLLIRDFQRTFVTQTGIDQEIPISYDNFFYLGDDQFTVQGIDEITLAPT